MNASTSVLQLSVIAIWRDLSSVYMYRYIRYTQLAVYCRHQASQCVHHSPRYSEAGRSRSGQILQFKDNKRSVPRSVEIIAISLFDNSYLW